MNQYRKGYMFERKLLKLLEKEGGDCIRSAGSHGAVDVIAFYDKKPAHCFQCQLDAYFPPAKIEALKDFCRRHGLNGWLAWNEKGKVKMKVIYETSV